MQKTARKSERMKKKKHIQFTVKQLSYVLIALYLVCLVPLFVIAKYDFPSSDDFSMALEAHLAWEETNSVVAAIAAGFSKAVKLYFTWTGYFTSSLLTTVSPATFGIQWYGFGAILVLVVLHISVIFFLHVLLQTVLHLDKYISRCAVIGVLFLMIQMMPQGEARVEAFYWYSGAGNYTLTFSLMLIYLSCLLLSIYGKTKKARNIALVFSCLSGFFTGGGNYMSALTAAILTAVLGMFLIMIRTGKMRTLLEEENPSYKKYSNEQDSYLIREKEKHVFLCGEWKWTLIIPMVFLFVGFFINCLAPGNVVRSEQTGGFGAIKSILISLYYTLDYTLDDWLNWAVILIFAVLAILFWNGMPSCRNDFTFQHPVIIFLLSYGVVSANVTPLVFAIGGLGAGRNQALFWMQFVLILMLFEWYLTGWFWRKTKGREQSNMSSDQIEESMACSLPKARDLGEESCRVLTFILVLWMGGSVMCIKVDPHYYSCTSATYDLVSGTARAYEEENERRLVILEDDSIEDAVLEQHEAKPSLLFYSDISVDEGGWDNFTMKYYFGKNSISSE